MRFHPYGNRFPKNVEVEKIEELVERLKQGDESAIEELIESHGRLAIALANKHSRRHKPKNLAVADELVAEAFWGLFTGTLKARTKLVDNNISPYLTSNICNKLRTYIAKDHLIPVSPSTIARRLKEGKKILLPKASDMNISSVHSRESKVIEIKEQIDFIINLETDQKRRELKRNIFHMRLVGYNDTEIAETLEISQQYVGRLRKQVEAKYKELEEE